CLPSPTCGLRDVYMELIMTRFSFQLARKIDCRTKEKRNIFECNIMRVPKKSYHLSKRGI
ncbi:hypothetical protein ACFLUW_01005, partial [Chloroflexota bacterium]